MKNVHVLKNRPYTYITSDEPFENHSFVLSSLSIAPYYIDGVVMSASGLLQDRWRKIILADDPELIKNGVQAIDNAFLEWFAKNPSCEWVEVKKVEGRYVDYGGNVHNPISYKIIIPQEVSKPQTAVDWLIQEIEALITIETFQKWKGLKEQAKEMQKEQHKHTFEESRLTHPMVGFKHDTFSDYYYETFNTTKP